MYRLGDKVQDITTGITGIASGRCEWLDGKVEYAIRILDLNNQTVTVEWIPEPYLKKVDDGVHVEPQVKVLGFGHV